MPLSYLPETMPQARGDQVMAPTPEEEKQVESSPGPKGGGGEARGPRVPTYLVEQLRQLHLHLLALEHVVLSLLADGRRQVELPGHRVGLLGRQKGAPKALPVSRWGVPGSQGEGTKASPEQAGPAAAARASHHSHS